jgi:hypothetical protein
VLYGEGENVAVECTTCSEVLVDSDRPLTPAAPADLCEYRGAFASGYTAEDIARVLGAVSARLGVALCCRWEYISDAGFGGDSDLFALVKCEFRDVPAKLRDLLFDGAGDGIIDPATIPVGPHDAAKPGTIYAYVSDSTRNWAIEDRRTAPGA